MQGPPSLILPMQWYRQTLALDRMPWKWVQLVLKLWGTIHCCRERQRDPRPLVGPACRPLTGPSPGGKSILLSHHTIRLCKGTATGPRKCNFNRNFHRSALYWQPCLEPCHDDCRQNWIYFLAGRHIYDSGLANFLKAVYLNTKMMRTLDKELLTPLAFNQPLAMDSVYKGVRPEGYCP